MDAVNKDFRLAAGDTTAKNAGADLSADANLAVTTDVEGYLRPTGAGAVDIGADEEGNAAFVKMQVAANNDNATWNYLDLDSEEYPPASRSRKPTSGRTAPVTPPEPATPRFRPGRRRKTATLSRPTKSKSPKSTAPGPPRTPPPSPSTAGQRTPRVTSKYTPPPRQGTAENGIRGSIGWRYQIITGRLLTWKIMSESMVCRSAMIRRLITALGMLHRPNGGSTSTDVRVFNNIIRRTSANASMSGIDFGYGGLYKVWNNIIYDFSGSGIVFFNGFGTSTAYVYNNTLYNNTYSALDVSSGNSVIAKNNIVYGSGSTNAYIGTFAAGTDYNATDGTDNIGQGANNKISQNFFFRRCR